MPTIKNKRKKNKYLNTVIKRKILMFSLITKFTLYDSLRLP